MTIFTTPSEIIGFIIFGFILLMYIILRIYAKRENKKFKKR